MRARLPYIDNLRVLLTVLVVAHHAAQPYGPTGGRWPLTYPQHSYLLGPFFHVNASFFMGLFFLVSGYFLPAAYDRKGAAIFLKDRFVRLGIPIVAFAFIVLPVFFYFVEPHGLSLWQYYLDRVVAKRDIDFAHLWFLAHLLVYACLYAAWRILRPAPDYRKRDFPCNRTILAYALLLACSTLIVRIWYPIDRWVSVPVPAELAHLPQYASLFVIGIVAYRQEWLERVPASAGRMWLAIGLAAVAARYAYAITRSRFLFHPPGAPGPEWQAIVWNCWEALLCVGMCVGLLYFFREHIGRQSGFSRMLSRNAYSVYIVHLPVVVAAQYALGRTGFGPLTLTVLATVAALIASFALSAAILRQIPGAEKVL